MTPAEMTKALTSIDRLACEARQAITIEHSGRLACEHILAIQQEAQAAMQEVDSDARKLAAFDGLLDVCRRMEMSLANAVAIQEAVGVDLPLTNKLLTEARDVLASAKPHTPDAPGT